MYVYALLIQSPCPVMGLGERPVEFLTSGTLIAAVQPGLDMGLYSETEASTLQAILTHDRVIQELFLQTEVLPLRFGTVFTSEQALRDHLQAQQQSYQERLSQLKGLGEFTLRWQALPSPLLELPTGKGRDYFLAKKAHYEAQQAEQQAAILEHQTFVNQLFDKFPSLSPPQSQGNRLDILWPRSLGPQVEVWLESQILRYAQITLTGPLPPYHFV